MIGGPSPAHGGEIQRFSYVPTVDRSVQQSLTMTHDSFGTQTETGIEFDQFHQQYTEAVEAHFDAFLENAFRESSSPRSATLPDSYLYYFCSS